MNNIKITFIILYGIFTLTACSMNHGQGVRPTASVLIGK